MIYIKRYLPLLMTSSIGAFLFAYYFIPHKNMQIMWDGYTTWALIISSVAILVGIISLFRTHYKKMMTKAEPNRWYSAVTIVCVIVMAVIGFSGGIKPGSLFNDLFMHIFVPLDATMFSLLAFYMASASFRAFSMRNLEASLLLIAALIVMLGQIPLGELMFSKLPVISQYILDSPNMAAQRAIRIGVAIGVISTALKILLGIERSVFGGLGGK